MLKLIKKASVYAPEKLGTVDVLIPGQKICQIGENIRPGTDLNIQEIDGSGLILTPGFIDSHEHIMGGGGEGGFKTRTPEVTLTQLTLNGVTTVVGCIGTDGVCRDMKALLAKAKGLEEEGITTFVYTGSYQIPVKTLSGSLIEDIMLFDKIIGTGEVAISDHRSSQPTYEEFAKIAAQSRVGGMLAGKGGIVNVHLGDGNRCLDLIEKVVEETEIPITQFLPTHVNRNAVLFEKCIAFAQRGGYVDFTGNMDIDYWESISDEVRVSKGIKRLLKAGVCSDNFTISSDGQGSLPVFNEKGEFVGLGMGTSECLLKEVRECVELEHIPLEIALKAITENPANVLKLNNKGRIAVGYDADLCLLSEDLRGVHTVFAKGEIMVCNGQAVKKNLFTV